MLNIAVNTFREIARNKYFYIILFFGFLFILLSIILWQISLWNDSKIIIDFWLSMIELFWLVWVLFVWSQLLFNEIEGKTIFLILSKPIKRYEFILWKFLGFSLATFLIIFMQTIIFFWLLFYKNIAIDYMIFWSILNTFLKLEIVLALVFFFSTFMSNMITIITSLLIYFLSHNFSIILDLANKSKNEFFIIWAKVFWLLFPPFWALNTKDYIWSLNSFSNVFLLKNLAFSLFFLIIILIFTNIIFNKKRFEN